MGTPFSSSDVPHLLGSYVHLASPKFWIDSDCINGVVRYVESSKNPHVIYLEPYGLNYLIRVDINCYNVTEKIEEHEQHSSH
jgi:hypothetical protein